MALNRFLALAIGVVAIVHSASAQLSIPVAGDTERNATVSATASQIANVDRGRILDGTVYPLVRGPTLSVPSLYYSKMIQQLQAINQFNNPNSTAISETLAASGPYDSVESFKRGYEALETAGLIEIPQAFDGSDEMFGTMRLRSKGYTMKLVKPGEWADPLNALPNAITYPKTASSKYTPNVVGFFCMNGKRGQLLPLAIKIIDTGLTYTKNDSEGEWKLAKMALESTEFNARQLLHYVYSHEISIPIQVEMMRSMAEVHPIYALLDYHFFGNLAIEYLGGQVLFSTGTSFDNTTAYGATGFLRGALDELSRTSVMDDYPTEIANRGLKHLPQSRYVKYGSKYYDIIKKFVTSYVHAYYPSKKAVQADKELQTWAARCSVLQGVNGFPSSFKGFDDLVKIVANFIFQNSVKHHFMNGRVTWHSQAAPFSSLALYNSPLPTQKGVTVNPLDYAVPSDLFPVVSYLVTSFYRPIPASVSALQAYTALPFANEKGLKQPIAEFHLAMTSMENLIDKSEANQKYPFTFIKPSLLPWFSFI
ncbi:hypothetical protein BBO99_00002973 [Phytophthora kernoviae]|uniref:Lipoxygenase domain-containing protein n=1 Tax=Phytophthora kernoviae TaxID=325452 RepID=A0A3R7H1Y6_9STRA|nr:hypothetical protein JM16_002709 [Phytophthora kernoviae]KAG2528122.1 hypothetical protein JM18_003369 [Phytophthora kernoviae]RLN82352.1 hypothetical protein BBO99_00002973 [Phytophthora kernoviae]